MKEFFAMVSASLLIASSASAEGSLNCLQWRLRTESSFVTEAETRSTAQFVIRNGRDFGFTVDTGAPNGPHQYHFTYDREKVVNDPNLRRAYEGFIFNLKWHLESMRGYAFECSFEAGGPLPRISGSN